MIEDQRKAMAVFPHLATGEVVMYLAAGMAGARPGLIVSVDTDGKAAITWSTQVGDTRIALPVAHGTGAGMFLFRDEYVEHYVTAAQHAAAATPNSKP